MTIAVTRSAGVTSKAGFQAARAVGAVLAPPIASTSAASRSSISIAGSVRRGHVHSGLRRGHDERDPGPRRGQRQRVGADLVGDVAVGRDPVGADDDRVDQPAGDDRRPGAVDDDPVGTPSSASSTAVIRAPCSSGRVSSATTSSTRPAACSDRTTPSAVPHSTQASAPALQCVCSRSGPGPHSAASSAAPRSPIARQAATSSSSTARAAASTASGPAGSGGQRAAHPDGEVHRGRPGRGEPVGRGGQLGAGQRAGGQRDAQRAGHPERGRAAHDEPADRVDERRRRCRS